MKCIPIHRHSLWGTLVRIRRGLALQNTWIFKDTLGLFRLTSQREWSRPLSPDALSLTLTFATLLDYHTLRLSPSSAAVYFIFFVLHPTPSPQSSRFIPISSSLKFACCLSFLWFWSRWGRWRDEHLSFLPLRSAPPSQRAASVWRGLRCGRWCGSWFFFHSNHSQRTKPWFDLGFYSRAVFFTSAMWMSPQTHPLHFWSNLHHMPLKGDEPTGRRAFP